MDFLINIGLTLALLVGTYLSGSYLERRHFESIRRREERHRTFPVVTFETIPTSWEVVSSDLAAGSVVVSLDYFKRFLAGLRALVGGRVRSYEPLLERARREAVLRMVESARTGGYHAIVNVRLETSRLASSRGDGKGTAGVEMLAFGTALKLAKKVQ
jgi:uncharacterized protein YbjQ (UPF0145 family)